MNKKWLALIFSIIMLIGSLTGMTSAQASSQVTVNNIDSVNPGQAITISGTSTFPEVVVKVVDVTKNLVKYIDTVQVLNGKYSVKINISSSASIGTHSVVVGIGSDVSTKNFSVVSPPPTGEPGGGGIGGGGIGVGGPSTSTTPTPTPTPKPTPTATPGSVGSATPVPIIINVDKSLLTVTNKTAADGSVTNEYSADASLLDDVFKQLKGKIDQGETDAAQIILFQLDNIDGPVKVNLSASALADAKNILPNAIISIQTKEGGYSLPLSVLDLAAIGQSLGGSSASETINIIIKPADQDTSNKIDKSAKDSGITQLGAAIDFTVTAEMNGKSIELNNFGTTYVERSIVYAFAVDGITATAVVFDPETGKLSFVPAVFNKRADGTTEVVIKRNGNSAYTVVSSQKTFDDVSKHWAKADIELLASKLIVAGTTSTSFAPENHITRAEFAALLVRSLGLKSEKSTIVFSDVKDSDWFAGTVGAAVKAKLVSGFEDKSFKPNDPITREQMAVMISRAVAATGQTIKLTGTQDQLLQKFSDKASINSWAKASVSEAVEAGIVTGVTDSTFVPSAEASRAQAVVMLKRMLQYVHFIN